MAEILKNAVYEKGEQLDVIVAEAPDLPGCLTQGATFEEARANLVDAIEVWLMSGLRSGEDPPVVNGCRLAITAAPRRPGTQSVMGTIKSSAGVESDKRGRHHRP